SAENKLIFAPGLLAGSIAPNSGRISVGAKSPLTGGTKEANVGGTAGHKLGRLGIKAVILEGAAEKGACYVIKVTKDGTSVLPAPELAGLGNYATASTLAREHGEKAGILCTGPAGEMRLASATVAVTDPEGRPARHAARGGLGAVMGAKGVKAIVIDDTGTKPAEAKQKDAFHEVCKAFTKEVVERKFSVIVSKNGTLGGLSWVSKFGSLPTRNFQSGSFEGSNKIGSREVIEQNAERGGSFGHICMPGCVVRCSNVMHDKNGKYVTSGFEYESSAMLGANLGIDDLDIILEMEHRCDDLGLDTIEVGVALGVSADAGVFSFGDGPGALALLDEIAEGTALGRTLGQGTETTCRVFGISRVPTVKGQGVPAHEPRKEIGTGVSYATSPQGADHTGVIIFSADSVSEMIETSRLLQIKAVSMDTAGLCLFSEPNMDNITNLLNGFCGLTWTSDDLADQAKSVLKEEVAFNRAAGLGPETDRLPDFFTQEPLDQIHDELPPPEQRVFNVPESETRKILNF
ncbi:MAG: aldehyde ferredoxin oxidoreductase, partial [Deltaproteobacteria bacterium]|nr:aldehyde ferredoxin oxidoreductase [Deltaproteobacteria bacterium]